MPKRSHLGWRTPFFRCLHFALSLVGFGFTHSWSQSQGLESMIILMAELLPMLFKQWEIERYKGFLIDGSAVPAFATGFDWYAQGTILRPGRLGSIVEIKRIKGPIFKTARKRPRSTVLNSAGSGLINIFDR